MFGIRKYNYENFTRDVLMKDMLTDKISGPRPGDRAPDFEGRTLEGDRIRLTDFQNQKNVVLTFGSATCPFTASSIRGMKRLFNDYSGEDVQFLFVYVREAHPGERLSAHENIKDKIRAAEIFRRDDNVEMPIIVDDVNGSIHRKYGKLPNPTYLIDRSGRVAFRSLWTRANVVEDALEELLERQSERGVDHAVVNGGEDRSMPSRVALLHAHRALQRGGRQSLRDFSREMGLPGRMTVMSSRIAEPLAMNPGRAAAGAAITAGVIVGALYVGRWLRRKRLGARAPYEFRGYRPPRGTTGSEYEAVGI